MKRFFQKLLSLILIFALNFVQLSTPILVMAQEESTPSATVNEVVLTPSPTNTPLPTVEPAATSSANPAPIATPEPAQTASPSATPTIEPTTISTPSANLSEDNSATESAKNTKNKLSGKNKKSKKPFVEGEAIVKFKENKVGLKSLDGSIKASLFNARHNVTKKDEIKESNLQVVKSNKPTDQLLNELKSDSDIEFAQPNYVYEPRSIETNDTYRNQLWGLEKIQAPQAWATNEGNNAIVAIIDDGVAYNHPDLLSNMWNGSSCKDENNNLKGWCNHGYDFEDNDSTPLPSSGSHGTHIAGTIAALKNNNLGIIGVAPQAKIMALKTSLTTSQIIKSISFAKYNGAKVINASWGSYGTYGGSFDTALYNSIRDFPGLFVAAAGNAGYNHDDGVDYHKSYPDGFNTNSGAGPALNNVIAVAATDQNDNLASFSDYGSSSVNIGAPGKTIYSTVASLVTTGQTFESVTPPAVPNGWVKGGTNNNWGTYDAGYDWGNVLYADINYPYVNNADTTITSPNLDISAGGASVSFWAACDTEYNPSWTDYMALEYSNDGGNSFTEILKWDEPYLDYLNSDSNSSGNSVYYFNKNIPSQYYSANFKLRFRWVTNSSNNQYDGCLVDDVGITKYSDGSDGIYENKDGTSMAAPHVAGVAALIYGSKPNYNISEAKTALFNSGDPVPALNGKTSTGKRINAFKALSQTAPSTNNNLSNLTVSSGSLSPAFSSGTTSYTGSVANTVSSISVTPTASDSKSSIKVNNVAVASGQASSINLNVGSNTITVVVTAENGTTKTYTLTITREAPVDITAPVVTITRSPNVDLSNSDYTLTVNFDDAVTKQYKLDNGNWTTYTGAVTVSSEGSHTFNARGTDAANNTGTAQQVTFTIDKSAPFVAITRAPNQDLYSGDYTLSIDFGDSVTKEYKLDSQEWTNYTNAITVTTEGTHAFNARGTDGTGNTGNSSVTFTIDKTGPVITVTKEPDSDLANTDYVLTVDFGDAVTKEYKLNLGNYVPYIGPVTVNIEGTNTFTAKGIDAAGNIASSSRISFTIDKTAPIVAITKNPNTDLSNTDYVLTVNFGDAVTKEYKLDSGSWTAYTGQVTVSTEGLHTFNARGTDLAGNTVTAQQVSFTIDKTAPILTINSPLENAHVGTAMTVNFSSNEQGSFECSVDGTTWVDCIANFTKLSDITGFTALGDEAFTLSIRTTDQAGNTTIVTRNLVKDTNAPGVPGTPTTNVGPLINASENTAGFIINVPLGNSGAEAGDTLELNIEGATLPPVLGHVLTADNIASGSANFTIDHGFLGTDGIKTATAKVVDIIGNIGPNSPSLVLTLDTTLPVEPVITSIAGDNKINSSEKNNVIIQGTAEANSTVEIILSDGVNLKTHSLKMQGNSTNFSVSMDLTIEPVLQDGTIITNIKSTDDAGNLTVGQNTPSAYLDTVTPSVSASSIWSGNSDSAKAKVGDTITLIFTLSEAALSNQSVVIAGHQVQVNSLGNNQYSATYKLTSQDTEGQISFVINYTDSAGNNGQPVSQTTDNSGVTFDKTAPGLTQVTAVPNFINNHTPSYTFSSTEAGLITYSGTCASSTTQATVGNNIISFNYLNDGTYNNCGLTVTDSAGNISSTLAINNFTVDTTAPSAQFTINQGAAYTNLTKLALNFSQVSEEISKIEVDEGNSGIFQSPDQFSNPYSYLLADSTEGSHAFRVRLTDRTGNQSQDLTGNIVLDTVSPVIANFTLTNKTTNNSAYVKNSDVVELTAVITDTNNQDINTQMIHANLSGLGLGQSVNPTIYDATSKVATWSNIIVTGAQEGTVNITANTLDAAGNNSNQAQISVEADSTIPTVPTGNFNTIKNNPLTIPTATLLLNSHDGDGDILLITGVNQATHGQVSLNSDVITFTPDTDFVGTSSFNYQVSDGGNQATGTVYIVVSPALENNQTQVTPTVDLSSDKPEIVLVDVPFATTVNVPANVTNASLDLSNLSVVTGATASATLTSDIQINTITSLGTISLQIPAGIVISGPSGSWTDNVMNLPNVRSNNEATPSANATVTSVVEIGFGDIPLQFNKGVRLVIPGKAGQLVGYSRNNTFTEITSVCSADSQSAGDSLPDGGDCKINSGSDLAIWTKHFTKFATYTQKANQGGTSSTTSSNNGGGGGQAPFAPSCNDPYAGGAPTLLSATASGDNQVTLVWSKAKDPVTHYVVSYGLEAGKPLYGNPNVGNKDTTAYTVKNLSGNTTYYFRVRAGNGCNAGDYSNEIAVKPTGEIKQQAPAEGFQPGVLGKKADSTKSAELVAVEGSKKDKNQNLLINNIAKALLVLFAGYTGYYLLRKRNS